MASILQFSILGLVAGIFSGLIGIGGATVIIPALIFLFKFTQRTAQGTTLAMMVLPVGLLAAWTYYKSGYVDLKIAAILAVGFFIGGLLGAKVAVFVPNDVLRRIFGGFLFVISLRMMIGK